MDISPIWITLLCAFMQGVKSFGTEFQGMLQNSNIYQMMEQEKRMEAMSDILERKQEQAEKRQKQALLRRMFGADGGNTAGSKQTVPGKSNSLIDGHGIFEGLGQMPQFGGFENLQLDPFGLSEPFQPKNIKKVAPVLTNPKKPKKPAKTKAIKVPMKGKSLSPSTIAKLMKAHPKKFGKFKKSKQNATQPKKKMVTPVQQNSNIASSKPQLSSAKSKTYPVINMPAYKQMEWCMDTPYIYRTKCSSTLPCSKKLGTVCVRQKCCARNGDHKDMLESFWETQQSMAFGAMNW